MSQIETLLKDQARINAKLAIQQLGDAIERNVNQNIENNILENAIRKHEQIRQSKNISILQESELKNMLIDALSTDAILKISDIEKDAIVIDGFVRFYGCQRHDAVIIHLLNEIRRNLMLAK